jgi:hypothetical protein
VLDTGVDATHGELQGVVDKKLGGNFIPCSDLVALFGLGFAWLAVHRHETYRSNAEDLAFTDQAIWNFLRGQAFRFSLYQDAEFKTDIDPAALKRPDSFLAFHVEPLLVLFAPLYLVWRDVRFILIVQALGWALGAIPACRIASRRLASRLAGLAFAAVYLLSPLGQWAVLSDFHTVLFAAPLLLWAADLADTNRPLPFLLVGLLAAGPRRVFRSPWPWAGAAVALLLLVGAACARLAADQTPARLAIVGLGGLVVALRWDGGAER